MKKALIFDLYGTLIDIITDEFDPWVYSVLSQYLSYHAVKIKPDELKEAYFKGIERHFQQSSEEYPEVDVYKIFQEIMQSYGNTRYSKAIVIDTAILFRSLTRKHFGLFPSLIDTLARLSENYNMAIISDAQWVFAEPEIEMLGLDRFFKLRILSSCLGFKKPDVRLFDLAMEKLKVRPEESVYIGDTLHRDLVGAKGAGMKCILFKSERLEYGDLIPDGCFFDYSMLEDIIDAIL
jgi:putative hydrolase of the HAD superfamily